MGITSSKKRNSVETTQNRALPSINHDNDVEQVSEQNDENPAVSDSSKQETPIITIKPAGESQRLNKDRSKSTFRAVDSKGVINHKAKHSINSVARAQLRTYYNSYLRQFSIQASSRFRES